MKIVGLDIGFGYTKVATEEGCFRFPSVVGSADGKIMQNLKKEGEGTDEGAVCVEGERFFVGENAIKHSEHLFSAREKAWVNSLAYKALLKYAYKSISLANGEDILVVTGLPVNHFKQCGDELVKTVKGVADRIVSVEVLLQPLGSYFDCLMDDDSSIKDDAFKKSRTGIIDIGYFTTDLITMEDLEFVKKRYTSHENGVSTAYQRIAQEIYDTYSLTKESHEIEKVIRDGFVKVFGKKVDVKNIIDKHLDALSLEIYSKAKDLWREGTDIDTILVTGGGAITLKDWLNFYEHIRIIEDSQYANVQGYLKYGRMLQYAAA